MNIQPKLLVRNLSVSFSPTLLDNDMPVKRFIVSGTIELDAPQTALHPGTVWKVVSEDTARSLYDILRNNIDTPEGLAATQKLWVDAYNTGKYVTNGSGHGFLLAELKALIADYRATINKTADATIYEKEIIKTVAAAMHEAIKSTLEAENDE